MTSRCGFIIDAMSVERGAWSVEPRGRRSRRWRVAGGAWRGREGEDGVSMGGTRHAAYGGWRDGTGSRRQETGGRGRRTGGSVLRWFGVAVTGDGSQRPGRAFTLVEVLVTVALIAVMSTLLTPAVRGLMGVTGPRGGMNTLASTLEQARLTGMESGMTTYVGFPLSATNQEAAFSSFIVFRQATEKEEDETGNSLVPVSRWMRMSQGVYLESDDLRRTESIGAGLLPKLGAEEVASLNVIRFDRFGKLLGTAEPVVIRVGSKANPADEFMGGANQHFELTVQPLTGRAVVVDKAKEAGR